MNALTLIGRVEELTRPVDGPKARAFFTVRLDRQGTAHSDLIGVNVVGSAALADAGPLRTGDLVLVEAYLHTTRAEPSSPRRIEVVATRLERLAPAPASPNSAAEPAGTKP